MKSDFDSLDYELKNLLYGELLKKNDDCSVNEYEELSENAKFNIKTLIENFDYGKEVENKNKRLSLKLMELKEMLFKPRYAVITACLLIFFTLALFKIVDVMAGNTNLRTVIEIHPLYKQTVYEAKERDVLTPKNIELNYIPDGYEADEEIEQILFHKQYKNENKVIEFSVDKVGKIRNMEFRGVDSIETLEIGEYQITKIRFLIGSDYYWMQDGYIFRLWTEENEDISERIIENIGIDY